MNLETCISIVAGYFYGVFVKLLQDTKERENLFHMLKLIICDIQIGLLEHLLCY